MKKLRSFLAALAASLFLGFDGPAAPAVVTVSGAGVRKCTVAVIGEDEFARTLRRNLHLSGCFQLAKQGEVTVRCAGGAVTAEGMGLRMTGSAAGADAPAVRMAARGFSDRMCETFAKAKGFARDRIAFVSRTGKHESVLCIGYPDGADIKRVPGPARSSVVGPRWKDASTVFYTGIRNAGPQVFEYDILTGQTKVRWSFRGLATGAAVSPDGRSVAIILSVHGNPELYVIDIASGTWRRLTSTKFASEGQPTWSPDGRAIAYVSNESRHPNLHIVDVATKKARRFTSVGSQNVDPDWGRDGRIAYVTKRDGVNYIAVANPAEGEASGVLVTSGGTWEHPSWARDGRHLVASRDKALFLIDTVSKENGGDEPQQLFRADGEWITPCWSK